MFVDIGAFSADLCREIPQSIARSCLQHIDIICDTTSVEINAKVATVLSLPLSLSSVGKWSALP